MDIILKKCGKDTVVVLSPEVLKDLGLSAGQAMTLDTNVRGEIVLARQRKFKLTDLIVQCNPRAPVPPDLLLWDMS